MSGTGTARTLAAADWAVIVAFFATMVAIGVVCARRQKSSDQFFGGDKSMPWYLAGVSFYMCTFSALAFVMYSALAYKFGFVPVTVSWLLVPAIFLGAQFTAVRWRRVAKSSPLDFAEERFGNRMRQSLLWLGIPMRVLDDAFKLLAIGTVVGIGLGFPLDRAIVLCGAIVIAYTFLGGLKATLVADFVQFLVLFSVVLALPFFCLARAGGFANFVARAPEGFFSLTAGKYTWLYMVVLFSISLVNRCTSWPLVQRYYSTRSEKDAKKVGYLVALLLFIGPPLFFLPAMTARVFMPGLDMNDAGVMNGVYASVCLEVLPAGMVGMVIAAMFSATMSTLAGDFNAVSSVLTNDFYVRMLAPASSARRRLVAARAATALVGALVIALTFVMRNAQGADDLLNVTNKMFSVFVPPIALPTVVGLLCRRVPRSAGVAGLYAGIAVGMAMFVAGAGCPVLREMVVMTPVTFLATALGMAVAARWRPDTPDDARAVALFFRKAETPS